MDNKTNKTKKKRKIGKKVYETKKKRKENLLKALEKSLGVVTTACNQAKLSRHTFYEYCKDDANFQMRVNEITEEAIDFVESKLYDHIRDGNIASAIFYLKTKAKNRGYSERFEIEGNTKSTISIEPYIKPDLLGEGEPDEETEN